MTKLDGNNRWQSKMLLPEHQEQYEARNNPKRTGQATSEELTMVRDYILLPHILTMLQNSLDKIQHTPNVLNRLYGTVTQLLMDRVTKDMHNLKRELSKRNIKITTAEQADMIMYHSFVCRGYEERLGIVREVMRSEIQVRLSKYINEVTELLKGYGK